MVINLSPWTDLFSIKATPENDSKEKNRKGLEIMGERKLFHYQNRQNIKDIRCLSHYMYLKNKLSSSEFFPPFLPIVGAF